MKNLIQEIKSILSDSLNVEDSIITLLNGNEIYFDFKWEDVCIFVTCLDNIEQKISEIMEASEDKLGVQSLCIRAWKISINNWGLRYSIDITAYDEEWNESDDMLYIQQQLNKLGYSLI